MKLKIRKLYMNILQFSGKKSLFFTKDECTSFLYNIITAQNSVWESGQFRDILDLLMAKPVLNFAVLKKIINKY